MQMPSGRMAPSMALADAGTITMLVPCEHPRTGELGSSGNATFLQCLDCGAAIIGQGGRWWVLRGASR